MIVNPAHHTALNARKRLIQDGHLPVDRELRLVELLVRAVKHCAKESVLWAHRRWCLNHCATRNDPSRQIFSATTACEEFSLIRQACTIYPRNYHGWTHWRYTLDTCSSILCSLPEGDASDQLASVVLQELRALREWINTHTTDYSAIHHIVQSSCAVDRLLSSSINPSARRDFEFEFSPESLGHHALALLSPGERLRSEAYYLYVRTVLTLLPPDKKPDLMNELIKVDRASFSHIRMPLSM